MGRPESADVLVLVIEILKRIPRHQKVTAKEIQQQLEAIDIRRDIRTVQRNLDMLTKHFDLIKDDRVKPYGYSWKKDSKGLTISQLSPQESLVLSLAEDYLSNLLPSTVLDSLNGFFQSAKYNLNPSLSPKERQWWKEKVRVVSETMPLLKPEINKAVFDEISEALYHDRLLTLEYYNAKPEKKIAQVMPLGLAQQGNRLYLVCRFDGYNNERSIAIHRVNKAIKSTFTFKRPDNFNLRQYDADGRFGFGEGEICQLNFCIKKEVGFHLLETPLSSNQQVNEFEDHYQISATVIDSLMLKQWLRGFGEDVWAININ